MYFIREGSVDIDELVEGKWHTIVVKDRTYFGELEWGGLRRTRAIAATEAIIYCVTTPFI